MKLSVRSTEPELMDSEGDKDEIRSALKELKVINKYLGGNSVTRVALKKIRKKLNVSRLTILDAGSGGADIINTGDSSKVTAFDKNLFICTIAARNSSVADAVCGDVLSLPFRRNSFDIIHASLFLHHFDNQVIIKVINNFCLSASHAVVINDLQRSYISLLGFRILVSLFSGNRLVKHDGQVSIRRGFRYRELKNMLSETGFRYTIQWKWAFRWSAVIYCNEKV